jgi:hypothetical protein
MSSVHEHDLTSLRGIGTSRYGGGEKASISDLLNCSFIQIFRYNHPTLDSKGRVWLT